MANASSPQQHIYNYTVKNDVEVQWASDRKH